MKKYNLMTLKGINPYAFYIMPLIYTSILIFIEWGDVMTIIAVLGLLITFTFSYNIATFNIRAREEDQEVSKK